MNQEQEILEEALDWVYTGKDYLEIKKMVTQYDLTTEAIMAIMDLVDEEIITYQLLEIKKRDYWVSILFGSTFVILGWIINKYHFFGTSLDRIFYLILVISGAFIVFRGFRKYRQPTAKKPKFEKHQRFKRKL